MAPTALQVPSTRCACAACAAESTLPVRVPPAIVAVPLGRETVVRFRARRLRIRLRLGRCVRDEGQAWPPVRARKGMEWVFAHLICWVLVLVWEGKGERGPDGLLDVGFGGDVHYC